MKKHTTIAAAVLVLFVTTAVMAQAPRRVYDWKADSGRMNYIMGLRSTNKGLTESSMMQLAKIKMMSPGSNYDEVKSVIDSLEVYGSTPSIRYKACLAATVCSNPAWFEKNEYLRYDDDDAFFASVAARMQDRILTSRAN